MHSALNSVLHCETSSLVGVRSTHCTVQAGHEKENSPKSPSAAQVMRGLPHFPHPEVLPVLACLSAVHKYAMPFASLGNPQVFKSMHKYVQVCNIHNYATHPDCSSSFPLFGVGPMLQLDVAIFILNISIPQLHGIFFRFAAF